MASATDNCGVLPGGQVTPDVFACADIGANNVTVTVTDVNGLGGSCTAMVTVADAIAPVPICQDFTALLDANGVATVTITDVLASATDNCGVLPGGQVTPDAFACADIGANSVTVTVTDVNGLSGSCTAAVTVIDAIAPVPVCQPFTAQLDANGVATVTLADVLASATDNCGVLPGGQVTPDVFACADVGANNVTVTVTDVNGLSGSCTAVVTVADAIAPVAVCQDLTIILDDLGMGDSDEDGDGTDNEFDGGSSDNCPGFTVTAAQNTFTCADLGPGLVLVTVTDASGLTANCTSLVTVVDATAPTAVCANATINLDADGNAILTPGQVDGGSTDACGGLTLSVSQTDFTCDDIGQNIVTLTVVDGSGNTSTCTATVNVVDPIPAVILCRPSVNTVNDPGVCGADVLLLPPLVIEENCSITNVARNPAPGVVFPTGTTLVTWTLTDAGGNTTSCLQNVTINDTEDPVVDCGNSFIAYTSWDNCGYPSSLLEPAVATDNCGVITLTDDTPNFFPPGIYMVNYTATDAAGNSATCMQWVKIYDTTLPKLTSCPDDIEVEATMTDGANVSYALPTGMDNCPGPIILVEANGNAPGDFYPLGDTEISYRLYDQNGQFVTCEFTISVVPIGGLSMDLACLPDLNIAQQNISAWSSIGWNPPLVSSICEACDVLASDDFRFIGSLSGHQYYVHTANSTMTFAEAMDYAENIGATIAVLEDRKEVPMIENEMPEGRYFIGLVDAQGTGEFKWINGDEFVSSDFGQVFENDTEEPAAVILNEEGEWEVVDLSETTANFVFEKTCIDLNVTINQNDEDNDEALIEPGSVAEVSYTAVDQCGNSATCGFEIAFVAEAVAYCEPTGIATDEENPYYIESFSLNGYTVQTGNDDGYGNHTDEHFLFQPGEVLSMQTVFAGPNIDQLPMYCRIWMDLNNDGDFFDEGELILQGADLEQASAELTIPNVAQNVNNTVMRIAISRLTYAESCGDFLNGEVEDYTISIVHPEQSQIGINQGGTVANTNLGADMFLYPNPVQGELFVKLSNVEAETATLRLFNSVGQLVATQKVDTRLAARLDVSAYNNGLYSITVEAAGAVRLTQKFVIEQ